MVIVRSHNNFKELVAKIKLEYIKKGKKVPTEKKITEIIAKKFKEEDILYEHFIRF